MTGSMFSFISSTVSVFIVIALVKKDASDWMTDNSELKNCSVYNKLILRKFDLIISELANQKIPISIRV